VLVAALAVALLRGSGDPGGPLVGKAAPDFTLTTLEGTTLKLSELRGRPVVLNFWASWCVPCREEAPLLSELATKQSADGLAVVGVVFQDRQDAAKKFRDQYGLSFVSVLDPEARTAIDYGVAAVPETFFIDEEGVVRRHVRSVVTRDLLATELRSLGVKDQ
ncbi:redoxin domain-containing protein, partial [Deinococcus pimensis]|uniref:redoxin domain-containing protein n=1 Tax=Deinococcus pimensis TaxID=309888 RepID=UPI000A05590D